MKVFTEVTKHSNHRNLDNELLIPKTFFSSIVGLYVHLLGNQFKPVT